MKTKKGLAIALIALLLALCIMVSACSGSTTPPAATPGSTAPASGAQKPADGSAESGGAQADAFTYPMEPITLTINKKALTDDDFPAWAGEHVYWTVLEEMTGVKLERIGAESNALDVSEEFMLLLASLDYPDLFMANWLQFPGGPMTAINDGYIISLNDYEEHYPAFIQRMEELPEISKMVRTDDGVLYNFPFVLEDVINANTGAVARKDWLDQLNLDLPVTIDDWHSVLTAFKNELNVSAPLTFESRWLFLEYAASSLSGPWQAAYPFIVNDGQVRFGPLEEGYREFLVEMNKWYEEGLIDPDIASVDKATVQAKFAGGQSGITLQQTANVETVLRSTADDPNFEIAGLNSPVLSKGDEPQMCHWLGQYLGTFSISISTQCRNIEAACRYLDFFYGEGRMLTNYGTEGFSYDIIDGEVVFTDVVMNNPERTSTQSARYVVSMFNNWPNISEGFTKQFHDDLYEIRSQFYTDNMKGYAMPPVTHTSEEAAYISGNYTDVDTYSREMILKFILGSADIEAEYDDYISTIKGYGIDQILEYKQAAYERYLNR